MPSSSSSRAGASAGLTPAGSVSVSVTVDGPKGLAKRSCATCRVRRIRCDRTLPECRLCVQSGRTCKGFDVRLSWPTRPNDGRRAVLADVKVPPGSKKLKAKHFVHVSTFDVQLYRYLHASEALDDEYRKYHERRDLGPPMPWHPKTLRPGEADLFSYFQHVASDALTTPNPCETDLPNMVMRTAFADDSPSSIAVLRALLALSSLHRNGLTPEAVELKTASLGALAAAASNMELKTSTEVMQHVAAGMLLCSFEVHMSSCHSQPWTIYISGIKAVLTSSSLSDSLPSSDLIALLAWVHYHDTLGKFTLRHRQRDRDQQKEKHTMAQSLSPTQYRALWDSAPDSMYMMEELAAVCDIVKAPTTPDNLKTDGSLQARIDKLDAKIRRDLHIINNKKPCPSHQIYSLAMLVYLHRGTESESPMIQADIDMAFELLADAPVLTRHFPLFIIGCEAHTDERRAIVLDLMERSVQQKASRSLWHIGNLLEGVWAQDDLAECRGDYWEKLSSLISRTVVPPSFV